MAEVAAKKAAARAKAEARRERVEQAKEQAAAAEQKVHEFETFRQRAIRLKKEEDDAAAAKQRAANDLLVEAAAATLADERASDPAMMDATVAAAGQRARAGAIARNKQQENGGAAADAAAAEEVGERTGLRRPRQGDVVVAAYAYEQTSDTDVSMRAGERFVIDEWEAGDDWALVRRLRADGGATPALGYVPYDYLDKAPPPVVPPPPPPPPSRPSDGRDDSGKKESWHFPWRSPPPPPPPPPSRGSNEKEFAREARSAHMGGASTGGDGGEDALFAQFDRKWCPSLLACFRCALGCRFACT
jgi:hypothetical protein